MKITLPFPDRKLSPNHHAHWRSKERARKAAFQSGFVATLMEKPGENFVRAAAYSVQLVIYPPDRRRRDLDNIHSSLKHSIDGICHALKVDDRQFRQVQLGFGEVRKGGQVEIEISPLTAGDGGKE